MRIFLAVALLLITASVYGADAQFLQDVSVTVHTDNSQGSGVFITRELQLKKDDPKTAKVNFVWTAGHVVDGLRKIRDIIDPNTGTPRKVIEYAPVYLVKELNENGRKVGETRMEGKVIKYSDADSGHDLALIVLHKKNFLDVSAKFYLDEEILPIGTQLFHVGSLLGQDGANSMTTGIISQIGRVLNLNGSNSVIFDQTTVTAFPGSSGGGVFLASDNRYIGMLVRGAGETFNLTVPVRRMKEFAKTNNLEWALDENVKAPSLEEILAQSIDDTKVKSDSKNSDQTDAKKNFPFLLKTNIIEDSNE